MKTNWEQQKNIIEHTRKKKSKKINESNKKPINANNIESKNCLKNHEQKRKNIFWKSIIIERKNQESNLFNQKI